VPEDSDMECAMFCERTTAHIALIVQRELYVDFSPHHGLLYKRSSNQSQSANEMSVGSAKIATDEVITVRPVCLPMTLEMALCTTPLRTLQLVAEFLITLCYSSALSNLSVTGLRW
jgi:hypothetical protein